MLETLEIEETIRPGSQAKPILSPVNNKNKLDF